MHNDLDIYDFDICNVFCNKDFIFPIVYVGKVGECYIYICCIVSCRERRGVLCPCLYVLYLSLSISVVFVLADVM